MHRFTLNGPLHFFGIGVKLPSIAQAWSRSWIRWRTTVTGLVGGRPYAFRLRHSSSFSTTAIQSPSTVSLLQAGTWLGFAGGTRWEPITSCSSAVLSGESPIRWCQITGRTTTTRRSSDLLRQRTRRTVHCCAPSGAVDNHCARWTGTLQAQARWSPGRTRAVTTIVITGALPADFGGRRCREAVAIVIAVVALAACAESVAGGGHSGVRTIWGSTPRPIASPGFRHSGRRAANAITGSPSRITARGLACVRCRWRAPERIVPGAFANPAPTSLINAGAVFRASTNLHYLNPAPFQAQIAGRN